MIPNRVFDEESIKKTTPMDVCQNPKNFTKPFAKLVSKFTTPKIKIAQIETKTEEQIEKIEKYDSLGNLENQTQEIQKNQKIEKVTDITIMASRSL